MADWRGADVSRLRRAILGPTSLIPLMQSDPERAAQLVLAATLREPGGGGWDLFDRGIGIVDQIYLGSPLPERSPMLAFLMHAPDVALRTIMRIVNHATGGWKQSDWVEVSDDPVPAFEILLDGERVTLAGNANVMHWNRGDARVPKPLASALMALEQFLYRRIDAGESVDDFFRTLMTSRSVAVFGLLVEVACYKPELLKGPLAPLITSAGLILADRFYKHRDHGYLTFSPLDVTETRRLQAWHGMPHRKKPIDLEILPLVVAEGVLVDELAEAREWWAEEPNNRWRFLIAQMDPANYEDVQLEGSVQGWQFVAPDHLQAEIDADQPKLDARMWWLTTPMRLAKLVEAGDAMSDAEAEELWDNVQERLSAEVPADVFADGIIRQADVECGAAAALLVCARNWAESRPEVMSFCREAVLKPFTEPPPTHPFDSGDELTDWSWDGFAATAVPLLWEREPTDTDLRQAAARLATHRHRNTVRRFFHAIAGMPALAEDVRRLETLSFHRARFASWVRERRHREEGTEYWPEGAPTVDDLPDVVTPTEAAFHAFVEGTLETDPPALQQFIDATPAGLVHPSAEGLYRLACSLDVSYLISARAHALCLTDHLDEEERERRLDLAAQFASVFAGAITSDESDKVEGTPSQEERHLFDLLGAMTARAALESARRIWEPILALGAPAHYWVVDFINEVWLSALREEQPPPRFSSLIKEMMAFAASQESWRGFHTDELELALLCLHRFGHPRMDDRHRSLLSDLQPEWSELAAARMRSPYSARPIVDFLARHVATDLTETGLGWLAAREHEGLPTDDDLDNESAELLVNLFARDPQIFRRVEAARDVLAALVARQNAVALELNAQVAGGS